MKGSPSATSRWSQGVVLLGGAMIVVVNLLIDILYAVIDPRIRLEG